MTRFEIIAKALPLHAQVIAERTYRGNPHDAEGMLGYLMGRANTGREPAAAILGGMFSWAETPEGFQYWNDLSDRCNSGHPA